MHRKVLKAIAALFAGLIVLLMWAKLIWIPIYKTAYQWLYDYSEPIDYGYSSYSRSIDPAGESGEGIMR